ncbi:MULTISPECIES: hypothetical protein [unclassified Flavobacterium]|uniref:hypothetical protein n=1 Tax=unclassified Flavobacterium TaxID=196869 RepID=UPI00156E44BF|nr:MULTISPECIES: hypothetical protein [unclassified Flavobacterium]MBE0392638.1 hypothetical protein [Flavobacterium sp. PL002]NRT13388.1 putative metal-binding protein [Flavobacterium sp. 14A]
MGIKKRFLVSSYLMILCLLSCGKEKTEVVAPPQVVVGNEEQEIIKVDLPEYSLLKKSDISIKTSMDANAPLNKRFTYKYLVSKAVRREQLPPLLTKLIEDIVRNDKDIDDITVWLYSDKKYIDGSYDVAMATFAPSNGEVTKEIALSNDKTSYVANFQIADNFEEHLNNELEKVAISGLSFDLRKKIYSELAETETRAREKLDKIYPYTENFDTENFANKLDELTKKYEKVICIKYKIDNKMMEDIYAEGDKNEWYKYW